MSAAAPPPLRTLRDLLRGPERAEPVWSRAADAGSRRLGPGQPDEIRARLRARGREAVSI